jgi:2'-5' RNA ligase
MAHPIAQESALLIVCPEGERAVGAHRARFDAAARVGVPAHVTVTYPFKPAHELTAHDHDRLSRVFGSIRSFVMTCESTAWFGEHVLYVQVQDPSPVVAMVDAVTAEFPDFPPYGGVFDELVPHVTVGSDQSADLLQSAQRAVQQELPFVQDVAAVELWTGPALATPRGLWTMKRRYRLQ